MRRLKITKFSSVEIKLDLASFLKEIKPAHFDSQLVRESEKKMSNSLARFVSIQFRSALCHSGIWKAVFLNLFSLRPFTHVKINYVTLLCNFYWRGLGRAGDKSRLQQRGLWASCELGSHH